MSITRINNNVAALNANKNLERTGRSLQKNIERLSSGLRINRAGDDAAGMTIATRLRSQVRGLDRAIMNAQDGVNLITVAEGAMEEMTQRLDRIRVLAVQAANTGVNDFTARQSIQDEVFQGIDEITRIAETTQFSKNKLLSGDFNVNSQIKPGQDGMQNYGINIDQGPSSSTLDNGQSFLNIIKSKEGFQQLIPGLDVNGNSRTMHLGVNDASDIAVSLAFFSDATLFGGTGTTGADVLAGEFFNGVSIAAQSGNFDVFSFDGVLADGVTKFNGTFSLASATSFTDLISSINAAIDNAEQNLFGVSSAGSVPTSFRTNVSLGAGTNSGRLLLFGSAENVNLSSIDIRLLRSSILVTETKGVTRSGVIGTNSILNGSGQIGNSTTAITGSTFGAGEFAIVVEDVQGAQSKTLKSTIPFLNKNGATVDRTTSLTDATRGLALNGTFVGGVYTGSTSISNGDTFTLRGVEADGTTFESIYTFSNAASTDTVLNDFQFASLSGLINELNYRTRDYTVNAEDGNKSRFESALFTLASDGKLTLIDDLARNNSQLDFTFTFNDSNAAATAAYTIADKAELLKEGFAESATFRLGDGPAVRATAGEQVTLFGEEETFPGVVQQKVTIRIGSNLVAGTDFIAVDNDEFIGSLNGGPKVTFQNGAQDVVFIDDGSFKNGVARVLTVDFDDVLDITRSPNNFPDPGTTIIISTVNRSMNFQIGAFAGQSFKTSIGDLTAQSLGFGKGSGRTVEDIDVRTVEGANEALRIVDEALEQINRTRSLLGAATNRLEGTISNLTVSSENLLASESRLRDADIARESTEFTRNQILLQASTSVLAQANLLQQNFLSLLG